MSSDSGTARPCQSSSSPALAPSRPTERRASCSEPTTTSRSRSTRTNSSHVFVACSDDVRLRWRGPAENLRYPELTPRELEVLELMAGGLEQPEIAKRLVISPRTVGKHIQHILEKLDVHSRAQAVALAHLRGIRR